jgi:hypothetical protein
MQQNKNVFQMLITIINFMNLNNEGIKMEVKWHKLVKIE